jgi:hypothetical protein
MMKNHFVKRKEKESKEIKSLSITHEILCATFTSTLNPNEVEVHINYFVLPSRKLSVLKKEFFEREKIAFFRSQQPKEIEKGTPAFKVPSHPSRVFRRGAFF